MDLVRLYVCMCWGGSQIKYRRTPKRNRQKNPLRRRKKKDDRELDHHLTKKENINGQERYKNMSSFINN